MEKRTIILSNEKFLKIDFSKFKCVKKHQLSHHDNAFISMIEMNYTERKDVISGVYYKDGFLIEVISFRGKSSVTCRELYNAQREIYDNN